ncbi:MAG: hypothetical protein WBF73_32635 [Bradyrhizobium sp.]
MLGKATARSPRAIKVRLDVWELRQTTQERIAYDAGFSLNLGPVANGGFIFVPDHA